MSTAISRLVSRIWSPSGSSRGWACSAGLARRERARLAAALATVGLTGQERRPIGTLSGGQLQRALFARVMVQDAPIILLDEPFAGLDAPTAAALARGVTGWAGEGRTVLVALHDLSLARRLCGHGLVLARRAVAWGPAGLALNDEAIERARLAAETWTGREAA